MGRFSSQRKYMNSKEIEKLKKHLKLNLHQRKILVGLLLGDAHLESQISGRTYRVKFEYSIKHSEYAKHIYDLFCEWILTPPQIKQDETHNNIWFQTVSHPAFRYYAHQFYKNGKKCVPNLIHRYLSPISIAYWFMDDGSIKSKESKGVLLNTQGFLKEDVARLVEVLRTTFKLQASERKQKDGSQIYISGESYEHFRRLVAPYIHPSMSYKIPTDRKNNNA